MKEDFRRLLNSPHNAFLKLSTYFTWCNRFLNGISPGRGKFCNTGRLRIDCTLPAMDRKSLPHNCRALTHIFNARPEVTLSIHSGVAGVSDPDQAEHESQMEMRVFERISVPKTVSCGQYDKILSSSEFLKYCGMTRIGCLAIKYRR